MDNKEKNLLADKYTDDDVEKNFSQRLQLLKEAADSNNVEANYKIGIVYKSYGNLDDAEFYLKIAADAGHQDAILEMFDLLYAFTNRRSDSIKYLKLASNFSRQASYEYAIQLLNGNYVKENVEDALVILRRLADAGEKQAISKLRYIYATGYKTLVDAGKYQYYRELENKIL